MKNITLFIFIIVFFSACRTTRPVAEASKAEEPAQIINYADPSTWLLGYFSQNQLTREPHSVWYNKGYEEYKPDDEIMRQLHEIDKDSLTITIVMGTWCPDSRREVPRFMKVLDSWRFPLVNVKFIGVDIDKNSPVGEFEELDIQRVPTFIIYKKNIEAGRIIENPVTSLEQDMLNILKTV